MVRMRRAPTQATPFSRAISTAVSAARAITRWPMPLSPSTSAVAGAVRSTRDVRPRIDAAGADAPHVVRQAEHAVRIGAGEVGLDHQLGDLRGIGGGQADGAQRVRDESR